MTRSDGFGTAWAPAIALVLVSLGILLAASPAQAKTFTVNYRGDATDDAPGDGLCNAGFGLCSLRAAIEEANAFAGADAIHFGIPASGVQTIEPTSQLPSMATKVTINGYTQPGSKPNTSAQGAINAKPLVELDGSAAGQFADGLSLDSSGSVVKGLVINRFEGAGIRLRGTNNRVEGNFIGTDPSGTLDLGTGSLGVDIRNSADNTVGGTVPAARNLISGNYRGITISDGSNNEIQGNLIGTNKAATAGLGNDDYGVLILRVAFLAVDNTVGGTVTGARNTIAFNGGDGVAVSIGSGLTATGNRVVSNSIHSNDGLGIDLGPDGPTPNDAKDHDTGPNDLQNKPVITSAKATTKKKKKLTSISGTLNSIPNRSFIIQVFSNPPGTDEGKTFLAQRTVKTNQNGNASFGASVGRNKAPAGRTITATATTVQGDTSEFSVPKSVT